MVNFHALGKSPSAPGFRLLGAALVVTILFFTFYSPFTPTEDVGFPAGHRPSSLGAANATLGFQKLFAISLPQRTDRHDALTLVSVLSGLEIEVAPGIRGEDVLTKTIPRVSEQSQWPRNLNFPGQCFPGLRHVQVLINLFNPGS